MRHVLLFAILLSGCRCGELFSWLGAKPEPGVEATAAVEHVPRKGLVAAVEADDAILVLRSLDGTTWSEERRLPRRARALRFSPDGSHVAWVEDETNGTTTVPVGHVWRASQPAPESLGGLGLRTRDAMGLAVAADGRVAYLAADGKVRVTGGVDLGAGWGPLFDLNGGLAFVSKESHCTKTEALTLHGEACGDVLEPLDLFDEVLVARTNRGLVRIDPQDGRTELALGDVAAASVGPGRRLVIIRRVDRGGIVFEQVAVVRGQDAAGALERPIVVSAGWDDDRSLLVVERLQRKDLLELMLAHAPAEFGGEASSGTAIRVDVDTREARPVAGLEEKAVRTLFRAREAYRP